MPELPDVELYVDALRTRIAGHGLRGVTIRGPFLLRSVAPPVTALYGHRVTEVRRAGKRIAVGFDHGQWLAIHLMIAGRLHWNGRRVPLAAFEFDSGTLTLTEAGTQPTSTFCAGRPKPPDWSLSKPPPRPSPPCCNPKTTP